jgi:hypothetical protein
MKRMKRCTPLQFILVIVVSLSLPAAAADPAGVLRRDLNRIFADSRLTGAQLGVKIVSLDRAEVVYEKNPSKLYMPASNNKILTAAVALVCLGPDYTFKTNILADGKIFDGILKGNLIIAGFGDPSSSRFRLKTVPAFRIGRGNETGGHLRNFKPFWRRGLTKRPTDEDGHGTICPKVRCPVSACTNETWSAGDHTRLDCGQRMSRGAPLARFQWKTEVTDAAGDRSGSRSPRPAFAIRPLSAAQSFGAPSRARSPCSTRSFIISRH